MEGQEKLSSVNTENRWFSKVKKHLLPLGAGIYFLSKLKTLLPLLKFGKFFGTFVSMFISILGYGYAYGWVFGIGLVILIFIHEMGHYMAAKYEKLDVSAPIFIPFVGAAIAMKKQPTNALVEAKVAVGGPLLGSIAVILTLLLFIMTNNTLFLVFTYVGAIINLFNLIPVLPLDGGRIVKAITVAFWMIGYPIILVFLIYYKSWLALAIIILGGFEVHTYFQKRKKMKLIKQSLSQIPKDVFDEVIQYPEVAEKVQAINNDFYQVPLVKRISIGIVYLSLIAFLVFAMYYSMTGVGGTDILKDY